MVPQLNCTARPDRGSSGNEPLSSPCVLLKLLRRGVGVAHTRLARCRCFRAQRRRHAAFVEQVADAIARIGAEQQQVGPKSGGSLPEAVAAAGTTVAVCRALAGEQHQLLV